MPAVGGTGTPAHDANAAGYFGGVAAATKEGEKQEKEKKGMGKGTMLLAAGGGLAAGALLTHALSSKFNHCYENVILLARKLCEEKS
jgi:hypothetical protein